MSTLYRRGEDTNQASGSAPLYSFFL
ncbi:unnamed protein product, partial [Diplocarpon coronariae]